MNEQFAERMNPIAAVMIHVSSVPEATQWYANAFPSAAITLDTPQLGQLALDGVRVEIVTADEKVSSGPCGAVVYWSVPNLREALERFHSLGALLYRGPMLIEGNQAMCQVRDPWGNCIGLVGESASAELYAKAEPES